MADVHLMAMEALVMEQQRQFALLQQQLQAQQPKAPEPIPDLIADPAGYHNFIAPGSCSLVVNPIAPNMLCDYFDKKSPGIIRG